MLYLGFGRLCFTAERMAEQLYSKHGLSVTNQCLIRKTLDEKLLLHARNHDFMITLKTTPWQVAWLRNLETFATGCIDTRQKVRLARQVYRAWKLRFVLETETRFG